MMLNVFSDNKTMKVHEFKEWEDKSNSEIVLSYLQKGGVLEIQDDKICMSEDDQLCYLVETPDNDYTLYSMNISFNNFIALCNELPNDFIDELVLNITRPRGNC